MMCFEARALSFAAMVLTSGIVCGEDYPNKPVRMVTSEPGGGNDFAARLIAQGLSLTFKQRVVVDNRGIIAAEIVAKAPPDGYTLLFYGNPFWLAPFLRDNVPYDPVRDFFPISLAVSTANILVVHPSLPVKSVSGLIALARARPGELNYSSGTMGAASHLAAELFRTMAGIKIVRVPYRGTGAAFTALIAGQVQVMFPTAGSVTPHLKSGRLRALAVTTAQPSALFPGLPTIAASGLPGYESVSLVGIFAPTETPAAIIDLLNRNIVRVLDQADVREKFFNAGVDAIGGSPAELAAAMKSEMARMGKVIRDAGIHE
jgi:tripartite-type tricarboxylate transporter receptor subunit TctC